MKYRHEVLRDARLLKGFTQTELAEATGLSVATINMVELGKGAWLKAIRTICETLDLTLPEVIITGRQRNEEDMVGAGPRRKR